MSRGIRLCVGCGLVLLLWASGSAASSSRVRKKLPVGVLVSLTGTWSTLGTNTKAALELGAAEINARSDARHSAYRVKLLVRDTQLSPELALEELKALDRRGVKVVIGPQSSAELAALKPYADAQGILLISPSATASSLAIPGDSVFRFCPNDALEGQAIVALMRQDGISTVVPFWRNDAGNVGLHDSVRAEFLAGGGAVAEGYRYDSNTTDYTAAIAAISSQVAQARASADPSTVAVYLAGFDEVVNIFGMASTDPVLKTAAWYGSDGIASSNALLTDSVASAFAAGAHFPNPIFGLDPANESVWQPVAAEVQQVTGIAPTAFALAAYDSLFVAYQALEASGGGGNFADLKTEFVKAADSYTGVTGPTTLDANGDRTFSDFDYWAIRPVGGALSWVVVGRSINGVLDCCVSPQ